MINESSSRCNECQAVFSAVALLLNGDATQLASILYISYRKGFRTRTSIYDPSVITQHQKATLIKFHMPYVLHMDKSSPQRELASREPLYLTTEIHCGMLLAGEMRETLCAYYLHILPFVGVWRQTPYGPYILPPSLSIHVTPHLGNTYDNAVGIWAWAGVRGGQNPTRKSLIEANRMKYLHRLES